MLMRFSTETLPDVDDAQRARRWAEALAPIGMTFESPDPRRFAGRVELLAGHGQRVVRASATSAVANRTARHIAADADDSLFVFANFGAAPLYARQRQEMPLGRLQAAVLFSDEPSVTGAVSGGEAVAFSLPRAQVALLPGAAGRAPGVHLALEPTAVGLIEAILNELFVARVGPLGPAAAASLAHVGDLVLLALGARPGLVAEARGHGAAAALADAARGLIQRGCCDPALSLATVAGRLGVAERTLQAVLARYDTSFTDLLHAARIAEVRRRLEAGRPCSIADAAYAGGFDSLATFYRVWRKHFAETPSEVRGGA